MANVIQVQQIPKDAPAGDTLERIYAELCYYYTAYTYKMVKTMPYKRVKLMVDTARRLQASHYYNLTQIAAAPHTDKGKGVKDLLNAFEGEMNG